MLSFHKFPHPGNSGLGYPHQDSPNIVAKRGFCSLLPRVSEDGNTGKREVGLT